MPLQLRWVGEDELDRVAETRMLCFAHSPRDLERFREGIRINPMAKPGDFLLAEQDGLAVGTVTSLCMTMWVRGAPVPCQGVAFVGTVKSHRRQSFDGDGVATRLMRQTLARARERGLVVSALMPFRASFYEHFGYGLVERRNEWTVPLGVLPHGASHGLRIYRPEDLTELTRFRQRLAERGQCDIERSLEVWEFLLKRMDGGFAMIDRPQDDGPVRGWMHFEHVPANGKDHLRVTQNLYEDPPALLRQLHFLASLRDQYWAAILTLPVDVPLNMLLREAQLPHRPVNHMAGELRQQTRMQLRVLDHKRLLEAMKLPAGLRGRTVVAIHEHDGNVNKFAVEIADGRVQVTPSSASAGFSCPDHVWAAIACGDLAATRAVEWGLAAVESPRDAQIMDIFSAGPAPFCGEYF